MEAASWDFFCICADAVEVGSVTAANPRVIRQKHSLVKKTTKKKQQQRKNTFLAKYHLRVPSAPFGPQRRGLMDVKSSCKRFTGVENRGPAAAGDC